MLFKAEPGGRGTKGGRSTFAALAPRRRKAASGRSRLRPRPSRAWARGPGLGGSLAEFQGHKEPASRVGEVVFALRATDEQIQVLAGMLEVL
jgi:hypothetical protein